MAEYRKLKFEKRDFLPVVGFRGFKDRNGSASEDFSNPRYVGFMAYHSAWYAGAAAATFVALSYLAR